MKQTTQTALLPIHSTPSPYATALGNTHMHTHITVEVGPVMSDTHTHTQNTAWKSAYYRAIAKADKICLTRIILKTVLRVWHNTHTNTEQWYIITVCDQF